MKTSIKQVKRFADSEGSIDGTYTHWIEYTDGTKKASTDDENHALWYKWSVSMTSTKYKENGFTIFEF